MGWFSVQYHWSPIIANRPSFPAKYNKSFLDELTKSDFLMKIKSRGHREFTSCVVVLRKFTFWPLGFFVALQTRFQLFSVESCFVFLTIYYLFPLSTMFPPKRSENNLGIPQFVLLYRFVLLNFKTMHVCFLFRSSGVNQRLII